MLLSEPYPHVKDDSCLPVVAWLCQLRVFLHCCLLGENNQDGMEEQTIPFLYFKLNCLLLLLLLPGELVAGSVSDRKAFLDCGNVWVVEDEWRWHSLFFCMEYDQTIVFTAWIQCSDLP